MSPFQAKTMWNQLEAKRRELASGSYRGLSVDGHSRDEMIRRRIEGEIETLENTLRREGRYNSEGAKERSTEIVQPQPRIKRKNLRAPNVPNKQVPWGGGFEPMRKVVEWGVQIRKKGGMLSGRDPSYEGMVAALQNNHDMSENDAREIVRHIFARTNMEDPDGLDYDDLRKRK